MEDDVKRCSIDECDGVAVNDVMAYQKMEGGKLVWVPLCRKHFEEMDRKSTAWLLEPEIFESRPKVAKRQKWHLFEALWALPFAILVSASVFAGLFFTAPSDVTIKVAIFLAVILYFAVLIIHSSNLEEI